MKNLRMKAARAARNLSQQQLAELVGVSPPDDQRHRKGGL